MTLGNFSQQADAYERSRPSYPDSVVDRLVTEASVSANDSVVEFGAGTGIFTRSLVQRQLRVVAIEPNDAMRRKANVSAATWLNGSFENCPLPDQSQSWAVAAQAFHWAEPNRALAEVHRVLKSGRLFSVLWNNRLGQECEVLRWTEESIRRHVPEFNEAYRDHPWEKILESTGHFTSLSKYVERHVVTMKTERYLDLWRSHNRLNTVAGVERFSHFIADLTDYLSNQGVEKVDVPYDCETWSARRVG